MTELPRLRPHDFAGFVRLAAGLDESESARLGYAELFEFVSSQLELQPGNAVLAALPRWIGVHFSARGWAWNGYYRLRPAGEALDLGHAWGPPVCTPLERRGEILTSGMCWDSMISNQCLLATDVSTWPGYVSCDGTSGLATASGLVCPIRNASGQPIGVWDLDAKQALNHADARAMDALFSALARVLPIESTDLGS